MSFFKNMADIYKDEKMAKDSSQYNKFVLNR